MKTTKTEADATTFVTNSIGEIAINNILAGDYEIYEISVGDNWGYEVNDAYISWENDAGVEGTKNPAKVTVVEKKKKPKVTVTISNEKQTGNLKISKINKYKDTEKAMKGVGFKIKNIKGEYIIAVDKNNKDGYTGKKVTGTIMLTGMKTATTEAEATEFVTDKDGNVQINNLKIGTYLIEETFVPEEYSKYFDENDNKDDGDYISWEVNGKTVEPKNRKEGTVEVAVNRQKSQETENIKSTKVDLVTASNTQRYVDLSGFVWEDINFKEGKTTTRNSIYRDKKNSKDTNDKLLQGVTVHLKTIDTNKDEKPVVTTGEDGKYKFTKVEIDRLSNLYIEFEYNGMSYQNVAEDLTYGNENTSKAKEGSARQEFNNKFQTITNNNAHGIAKDNTEKDITLKYKEEVIRNSENNPLYRQSTLKFGDNSVNGYDGARFPITGVDEQYRITANTYNAFNGGIDKYKSPNSIRTTGITEVEYLNLGVYEREQPTLSVKKDIEQVQLAINGFNHIYKYGNRFDNADYGYNKDENGNETFKVGVKFGEKYGNMSYSRAVYKSDYEYSNSSDTSRELQASITYRIEIANRSTNLKAKVNNIFDYYDARYPEGNIRVTGGTELEEDTVIITKDGKEKITYRIKDPKEIGINSDVAFNNQYRKLDLKSSELGEIEPQKAVYIDVEFTMDKTELHKIMGEGEKATINNIAEISSYSIFDGNDKVYAGIDTLSNPGNCVPGNADTYEMDTDKAPAMTLEVPLPTPDPPTPNPTPDPTPNPTPDPPTPDPTPNPTPGPRTRKIEGSVFEDKALQAELDKNIRQGNGEYDVGENLIKGVTVSLIDDNGNIVQRYDENNNWQPATMTTESDGKYHFEGFIPGNYKIKFTWGDENYKVQNYKGTIFKEDEHKGVEFNGQLDETKWYKNETPRYSDAIDDYGKRKVIDEKMQETNRDKKELPEELKKMDSYTRGFTIEVEKQDTNVTENNTKYEYNIKNIDFGIIRRPIQEIELTKRITHVKLTLANGQPLIDANINEKGEFEGTSTAMTYGAKSGNNNDEGYPNGYVKIEMDNEIIQGAVLEVTYGITVTNKSERDYIDIGDDKVGENFYKYGTIPTGQVEDNHLVSIKDVKVVDYLDKEWSVEKDEWEIISEKTLQDECVSYTVKPSSEVKNRLILRAIKENISLKPNKTTKKEPGDSVTIDLKTAKTLTTSNSQDIELKNDTEIYEIDKTGGGEITGTIPGNYEPGKGPYEVDDDKAETLIITPNTGANYNFVLPISIAIGALAIIAVGIVVIKKKAIGKEE